MTDEQAGLLVKRLLGSYSALSLHDPETYIAELMTVLLRYSEPVADAGVRAARRESPKFVPHVAEVETQCEEIVSESRWRLTYGEEWDRRSEAQLAERARIEAEKSLPSPGFLERMRGELAAHGIHILGSRPEKPVDVETVRVGLGLSVEQWNALRDQPPTATCWKHLPAKEPEPESIPF